MLDKGLQSCNFMAPNDQSLQSLLNGSTIWDTFRIESGLGSSFLPVLEPYANMTGFLAMVQWVKGLGPYQIGNETVIRGFIIPNTNFEAGRCVFYFSVMEVQAQVNNGNYSEEILQKYTRAENPCIPSTGPNYNYMGTIFCFVDPFDYEDIPTLVYKPPFAKTPPNRNDTFIVPWNIFDMIISQIVDSGMLQGGVSTGSSSGALGTNDILLMLYEASSVTRALQNMAHYMTTEIRAIDSNISQRQQSNASLVAPQQAIIGEVWVQKTFVNVEWAWLAFPIVLLILSILFLVVASLKTRIKRVGLWNLSPLTLFFHGQLSSECPELDVDSLNTADAMMNAATDLRARIIKDSRGAIEVYSSGKTTGITGK